MLKKSSFYIFFIFVACFSQSCFSQVQLGLEFNRDQFIQHEGIDLTLHVVNDSGTQLQFGKKSGKIEFLILSELNKFSQRVKPFEQKDKKGKVIENYEFNPAEGLILGAGESKTLTIRINKYFPLAKALRYRIKAVITHPALSKSLETKNYKEFEVMKGDIKKTKIFGVTDIKDPSKVKTRKYDILGFNIKNNSIYCLKIYDDKWVYALHRLGPQVQGIPCQHQVDTFSNIHILIQLQPKVFMHTIFSPEGVAQQEVIYKATFQNVPRLIRDTNLGKVSVLDGLKTTEGVDYVRKGAKIHMLN